jgi:DNA-binding PadR family transcriptional regulator
MQHYHLYVNLRTKDVGVNGALVYSEVRYTITDQGRAYLAELRIKEESADRRTEKLLTDGVSREEVSR